MGRLYPSEKVYNGDVPAANGSDHLQAAKKLLNEMRAMDDAEWPLSGMAFGSVITGKTNRRSDVDFLIVYSSIEQLEALGILQAELAEEHKVIVEPQTFQQGAFDSPATHDVSPLFGSHLLDVQDNYPRWTHGSPVESLRGFVIGPESAGAEDEEGVLRDVMSYTHYKLRLFASACLRTGIQGSKDLYVMQRALELPKGLGRKSGAIVSVLGDRIIDQDVTDRAEMQESFSSLIEMSGDSEMLPAYNKLVELDQQYDEILEDAAVSGDVTDYDMWLDENAQDAARLAHELADGFSSTVRQLGRVHGVDIEEAPEQAMR